MEIKGDLDIIKGRVRGYQTPCKVIYKYLLIYESLVRSLCLYKRPAFSMVLAFSIKQKFSLHFFCLVKTKYFEAEKWHHRYSLLHAVWLTNGVIEQPTFE